MSYRKKYKYDRAYRPNCGKSCGFKYGDDFESSFLDGTTTSVISHEEAVKRPFFGSPHSISEYRRHRNSRSRREGYRSPVGDYEDYLTDDEAIKNRSKQTRRDMQNVFYQLGIENDITKMDRRSRSPRRRHEYDEDSVFERPEKDYGFSKNFEKAKPRGKKFKDTMNEGIAGEDRTRSDKRKNYPSNENDYQVFAYKEPKLHEKVFRYGEKNYEKSPPNSEIEIKTYDYPILAFKDNNVSQGASKTSSVFYLPTVYCKDKKFKSQKKHRAQSNPPGDTQVFAANIKEKNNIFRPTQEEIERDKQNPTNKAVSELQTEGSLTSRNTKLKEDSNGRISTETQTDASLIFEYKFPVNSNYKNAGSILGSVLETAEFQPKTKDNSSLKYTNVTKKYEPTVKKHNLFAYQIDIDIDKGKKHLFKVRAPKKDPSLIECKKIEDPLIDNFPVTKDYIKVSDNISSIQIKKNISRPSDKTTGTPDLRSTDEHNNKYIRLSNHHESIEQKGVVESGNVVLRENESIIKDISESIFNKIIEHDQKMKTHGESLFKATNFDNSDSGNKLQSHNPQVFRSTVNNTFKKSMTQRPSTTPLQKKSARNSSPKVMSHVDDQMSKPLNTESEFNLYKSEPIQPIEQIFKGNDEATEESVVKKEKMSVTNQKGASLVSVKKESLQREDSWVWVEKPNINSDVTGRKSQSMVPVIMDSKEGTRNEDSPLIDRKSQAGMRKSTPNRSQDDRKSQLIRESKKSGPNRASTLDDRKRLSTVRESRALKPSTAHDPAKPSKVRKSKSILKSSRAHEQPVQPVDPEYTNFQKGPPTDTESIKSKDERRSVLRDDENKIQQSVTKNESSRPKLSQIFSKNKSNIESENEMEVFRKSERQSFSPKSEDYTGKEKGLRVSTTSKSRISSKPPTKRFSKFFTKSKSRVMKENDEFEDHNENEMEKLRKSERQTSSRKSEEYAGKEKDSRISSSSKSKISSKPPTTRFSRFFSKSKSRIMKENDEFESHNGNKETSDTKLLSAEETTSQETLSKKKSKLRKSLKSKSQTSVKSDDKSKSMGKKWGFFTGSKSKLEQNNSSIVKEPEPQSSSLCLPGGISSEDVVKQEEKQKSVDENKNETLRKEENKTTRKDENGSTKKVENGTTSKEEKPCNCITQYVKQARECGNFFLGPTLHEQIMDILKTLKEILGAVFEIIVQASKHDNITHMCIGLTEFNRNR